MGSLFKSSKSKSTSGPAAYTSPYVQGAMDTVFDTTTKMQPQLDALGKSAQDAYTSMAPGAFGTNPYVSNAQRSAGAIGSGALYGTNPGQATYDRLQGPQVDPSTGLLSKLARGTPGADALAAGGKNPATGIASNVAKGGYLNSQPSSDLYSTIMGDDYLKGNPYLDQMIAQTNADVTKNANRMFSARGMGSGISSAFADVLSGNLADNEGRLRYQNFNDSVNRQLQAAGQSDSAWSGERGRMDAATGLLSSDYNAAQNRSLQASQDDAQLRLAAAQGLGGQYGANQDRALEAARAGDAAQSDQVAKMLQALGLTGDLRAADYAGVAPMLDLLKTGATVPLLGLDALQGGISNLTGATNSSSSKSSGPGLMYNVWSNAAGSMSDRRAKTNIVKLGELDDGLGVYDFDYIDPAHGPGRQTGVMADEVAQLRPWALGPTTPEGFATVNYGAL